MCDVCSCVCVCVCVYVGKLDSLKSAVDLMEESSSKLSELSLKIDSTEGRIALTDTTISDYPNVKRAHFARDNINKVISEVIFWTAD